MDFYASPRSIRYNQSEASVNITVIRIVIQMTNLNENYSCAEVVANKWHLLVGGGSLLSLYAFHLL